MANDRTMPYVDGLPRMIQPIEAEDLNVVRKMSWGGSPSGACARKDHIRRLDVAPQPNYNER